jgi:hypothetical protein
MSTTHINRIGIVDGVEARRKDGQVVHLLANVRFETEIANEYGYGEKMRVDVIQIALGTSENVNPGDVVVLNVEFTSPLAQRFQPALTVGDEPEDQVDEHDAAEVTV